jgi:formylglycine-generating enzyme required for sulfatase activity
MAEGDKSEASVYVPGYGELAMRLVPAGTFWMGSADDDEEADDDERPRHEATLSRAFQLSPTPVTQGLYEVVMGSNPSHLKTSAEHPVERVSWFDAVRFCNALSERCGLSPAYTIGEGDRPEVSCDLSSSGLRLPTEAEWEYAARAGQDDTYSGSSDADEVAWYTENSDGRTHPVGRRAPNAWGLYDMSGNVCEWCWDWKGAYQQDASVDPSGPSAGSVRVIRGGSWSYRLASVRVAYRDGGSTGFTWNNLGLRLSRA